MKFFVLISALLFANTQAFAAIMYQPYSCNATHGPQSQIPIADAPLFSLNCLVGVGGISGENLRCTLNMTSMYPVRNVMTVPLKTVSYSGGQGLLQASGTSVRVDVKAGRATIALGNSLFSECKYNPAFPQ
jgi:hypothetical protein